ncbi:MAG: nickel pincer cofactor biosynthesis protein LarB [Candidatus Omnitrophota bacterium]|nr:nickel pincer cofactor biosynthesis protein LarB [Candidatus Omnitrophota bacterium]
MRCKGFVELDFAKLDIIREKRRGLPEIIYAPGKTTQQLKKIINEFKKHTGRVFISRLDYRSCLILKEDFPSLTYFKAARLAFLGSAEKKKKGYCLIITAGTSDINVAEEAAVFLELTGNKVERIYDVGVAGIHRLEPFKGKIRRAKVIIVVAGMEAALLSIVSGISRAPAIGVPTSVGYGASFKGVAALLAMLNCCSPGTVTVNIDNGLGAGYFAHLINK